MDTSVEPSDYEIAAGVATMHLAISAGRFRRGLFPSEELLGEGGIVSTLDDMLSWTEHLLRRDQFGAPDTWSALLAPPAFPDGKIGHYALGLTLGDHHGVGWFGHTGGAVGGASQMLLAPDQGLSIVILSNGAPGLNVRDLAFKIMEALLPPFSPTPPARQPRADCRHLLGDWHSSESGMLYAISSTAEGTMTLLPCGQPPGMAIQLSQSGCGSAHSPEMGEIQLLFGDATCGKEMAISFGGHQAAYRKLPGYIQASCGESDVRGSYVCQEIGCSALLHARSTDLEMVVGDAYGSTAYGLELLDEHVAHARPRCLLDMPHAVLTFSRDHDVISGFTVNTARTRNLRFVRSQNVPAVI